MSGRYLLDKNAIISFLKGDTLFRDKVETADFLAISIISVIEFLCFKGLSPSDKELFGEFCSHVAISNLVYDETELLEHIVSIRSGYALKTPDAIICATARHLDAELLTSDKQLLSTWSKPAASS